MKYVRLVLGALIGIYGLMGLYHMVLTIGHKAGVALPGGAGMEGLMDSLAIWQVAVLTAAMIAYLVAAYRLLRGGKALIPYAAAFVLDTACWLTIKDTPAYQAAMGANAQMDFYVVGAVLIGLLLVWWTERSAPAAAAA